MRILHIGDIVGKPGRTHVCRCVPGLRRREGIDFVIANAENAAGGSGLTQVGYKNLLDAQVDAITMGDHIYKRREIFKLMDDDSRIVKPANFPRRAPGKDWLAAHTASGVKVAVMSLLGRVFMRPVDCPFEAADRVLADIPRETKCIFVDLHAEATSDMQLVGRYLDGRVTSVLGTHTHVPTADEQILPHGTAFQCDLGMSGPHDSILGRRVDRVLETTRTFWPTQFDVASRDIRLNGSLVDVDPATGRATSIRRIQIDEEEAAELEQLAASSEVQV